MLYREKEKQREREGTSCVRPYRACGTGPRSQPQCSPLSVHALQLHCTNAVTHFLEISRNRTLTNTSIACEAGERSYDGAVLELGASHLERAVSPAQQQPPHAARDVDPRTLAPRRLREPLRDLAHAALHNVPERVKWQRKMRSQKKRRLWICSEVPLFCSTSSLFCRMRRSGDCTRRRSSPSGGTCCG